MNLGKMQTAFTVAERKIVCVHKFPTGMEDENPGSHGQCCCKS